MENNPSLKGQGSSGAFNRVHVRVRLITVTPTRAYLLLANKGGGPAVVVYDAMHDTLGSRAQRATHLTL
ncbi:unnamed protein product [Acanthocheilonema viteae]|uniref:Uncharacterized protein n=1 Tax=Acanthocheilonema viteae TaxID=6277 RepID=A0A498SK83_ACAVI|nr:unnamed protein product [Acanthocheilonema viteae]